MRAGTALRVTPPASPSPQAKAFVSHLKMWEAAVSARWTATTGRCQARRLWNAGESRVSGRARFSVRGCEEAHRLLSRSRSACSRLPRSESETFSSAPLLNPGLRLALCETAAMGSRLRARSMRISSEWAGSDERLSGYETPLTTKACGSARAGVGVGLGQRQLRVCRDRRARAASLAECATTATHGSVSEGDAHAAALPLAGEVRQVREDILGQFELDRGTALARRPGCCCSGTVLDRQRQHRSRRAEIERHRRVATPGEVPRTREGSVGRRGPAKLNCGRLVPVLELQSVRSVSTVSSVPRSVECVRRMRSYVPQQAVVWVLLGAD